MHKKTILALIVAVLLLIGVVSLSLFLTRQFPSTVSVEKQPTKDIIWGVAQKSLIPPMAAETKSQSSASLSSEETSKASEPTKLEPLVSLDDSRVTMEAATLTWKNDDGLEFGSTVREILSRKKTPVITIQPALLFGEETGNAPFELAKSVYNPIIQGMCKQEFNTQSEIFINFAPDMDKKSPKRIWATDENYNYIDMYNNFVMECKANSKSNFRYMWSPAVEGDFLKFKPGEDSIDLIGFNISTVQNEATNELGKFTNPSFKNIFDPKYEAIKFLKHDVMINLSIDGELDYQNTWLSEARTAITKQQYQRYLKYVIFNPNYYAGTTYNSEGLTLLLNK